MPTTLLSVRRLEGFDVYDCEGDKLGTIADVMLDVDAARVRYIVLACNASLDKKRFAVPLAALRLDTENECFVLDSTKQSLSAADGFAAEAPPPEADPLFGSPPIPQLHLSP
jgi:uncharacterized protein YrrD